MVYVPKPFLFDGIPTELRYIDAYMTLNITHAKANTAPAFPFTRTEKHRVDKTKGI